MVTRVVFVGLIVLVLGLAQAKPLVVVSINPYGDLIEQLAGDLVEVVVVLPAGSSPHTFEPTPRAAAALAGADLVVLNGGVDEWLHDLVEAANPDVYMIEGLEVLETHLLESHLQEIEEPGEDSDGEPAEGDAGDGSGAPAGGDDDKHVHEGQNPHVWLDPSMSAELVLVLGEALAGVDPANASDYRERAESLRSELLSLDEELRVMLSPIAGAPFIPFHDAWPYFARRYELDLLMEIEPFPGREPSPRYLAEAVRVIRESRAPAIFNEVGLSDRPAKVLADEAGVEVYRLDPLGARGESYQDLMRRNAALILEALAPWAPE